MEAPKQDALINPLADARLLLMHRHQLAMDCLENARQCIRDLRGDLALKAIDVAENQILQLRPQQ